MASRTHPGVLWSHNDGGDDPGVFAIGSDGFDIGFHALDVDGVTDVEDIAIAEYGGTEVLYLADIGDNDADRGSVRVYRFAEPDPGSLAPITEFEVLEYVYPDRPYNAETLLIDDADQRLVIVTKEQEPDADGLPDRFGRTQPSFIFEGPLEGPAEGEGPRRAHRCRLDRHTPELETPHGERQSSPGDCARIRRRPDGRRRLTGRCARRPTHLRGGLGLTSRAQPPRSRGVHGNEPCQVASVPEAQGEAVAFVDGGLVTLGEGVNPPLNRLGK